MKSGRPVLYELLKTNPNKPAKPTSSNGSAAFPREEHASPLPESDPAPRSGLLANGRTVRVPAGYIFVFIALLILCGTVAYIFGYVRGESEAQISELDRMVAEQENDRIGEQLGSAGDRTSQDQSTGIQPPNGSDRSSDGSISDRSSPPASGSDTPAGKPRTFSTPIEPRTDPRKTEHYYFRLANTPRKAGAVEVAEFCRENGVEAFIIGSNNSDYFTVYVLPGFKEDERQSPAAGVLRDAVDNIVTRWFIKYGRDELRSYYLAKYDAN